jgi:hypothetical protein
MTAPKITVLGTFDVSALPVGVALAFSGTGTAEEIASSIEAAAEESAFLATLAAEAEVKERERKEREESERFWLPDLSGLPRPPARDWLFADGRDDE